MADTTDELETLAEQISKNPPEREMDMLLATGEQISISLLAMAIHVLGRKAISFTGAQVGIVTDRSHTRARIVDIDCRRVKQALQTGNIVIVAGFQGRTAEDEITTLGRGGSDLTAVALAKSLQAHVCEIYTDVDGIYTTDPRLVPEARKLKELGYEDMLEMAALGAKMNPRSIELAAVYGVPVLVALSSADVPGTLIHGGEPAMEVRKAVTGIAVDRNVAKITVSGVQDQPGVAAAIFEPLADAGINVDVIVQNVSVNGLTDMTFTVSEGEFQRAREIAERKANVKHRGVLAQSGLAKVSIVGTGMQNAPGYASKMFRALADAGVNIEMVTTSEIRITCLIKREQVQAAAQSIHKAFDLATPGA
jgi:aspartate kinase